MVIRIENSQSRHSINLKLVEKKAKIVLEALGSQDGELSLLLVDDEQMKDLNKKYLGRSGPTNVIAFPMNEGPFAEVNTYILGDVAISLDTTSREAKMADLTLSKRFDQLLIHGILHLFGFDHEGSKEEKMTMEKKEKSLLKLLEIKTVKQ